MKINISNWFGRIFNFQRGIDVSAMPFNQRLKSDLEKITQKDIDKAEKMLSRAPYKKEDIVGCIKNIETKKCLVFLLALEAELEELKKPYPNGEYPPLIENLDEYFAAAQNVFFVSARMSLTSPAQLWAVAEGWQLVKVDAVRENSVVKRNSRFDIMEFPPENIYTHTYDRQRQF